MSSCGSYIFGIHAFDLLIRVQCPNSESLDTLNRYLFPPLPRTQSPGSADIDVRVDCVQSEFSVLINETLVASASTLEDATLATVKALDDAVVERLKGLFAVHAGAVLLDDRALLLPGSTHAGKSSLVAELLRQGASYFSDEYALIDRQGRVHPYPRPLLLRNGQPRQSLVLPEELNSCFAGGPAWVGWIVATEYVPGDEWDAQAISQSEAVMLLLRNTPHEMAQSPGILDFFRDLAAKSSCYEGSRGDVADAATRLLDLTHRK